MGKNPLITSTQFADYEGDYFSISFPSNWVVQDINGVLNATPPEGGIFTASVRGMPEASLDEITDSHLATVMEKSRLKALTPVQRFSCNNWEGLRQEGKGVLMFGVLGRVRSLLVAAYRDPVLVFIIIQTNPGQMKKLRSSFKRVVESLVLRETDADDQHPTAD